MERQVARKPPGPSGRLESGSAGGRGALRSCLPVGASGCLRGSKRRKEAGRQGGFWALRFPAEFLPKSPRAPLPPVRRAPPPLEGPPGTCCPLVALWRPQQQEQISQRPQALRPWGRGSPQPFPTSALSWEKLPREGWRRRKEVPAVKGQKKERALPLPEARHLPGISERAGAQQQTSPGSLSPGSQTTLEFLADVHFLAPVVSGKIWL